MWSIYIDAAFKSWLKKIIGDENYQHFDPRNANRRIHLRATKGKKMRAIMRAFEHYRRNFSRHHWDIKFDLPKPLDDITVGENVLRGELTITN
jgi:hypothetical protein